MENQQLLQNEVEEFSLYLKNFETNLTKDAEEYIRLNTLQFSSIQSAIENITNISKDIDNLLEDDEVNILTLTQKIKNIHEENTTVEKEVQKMKQYMNSIESEVSLLEEEIEQYERETSEKSRSLKNELEKDQLKDYISNELLALTQNITNIRWAADVPSYLVKGFVVNNKSGTLMEFCYDKRKETQNEIRTKLWKLIEHNTQ